VRQHPRKQRLTRVAALSRCRRSTPKSPEIGEEGGCNRDHQHDRIGAAKEAFMKRSNVVETKRSVSDGLKSNGSVTTPRALTNHQGQRRDKGGYMSKNNVSGQPWLVVSKEGLRKTLERKGKAFAIFELLQNAFDEDSTKVLLTLTKPQNGKSTLTCVDDAPQGYVDLSDAHTIFAESKKKADHKKRGRFNVGEKYVLALCDKATITSTTGRVIFHENGTRTHDSVKTRVGTEFRGELSLTEEEFNDLAAQVKRVIPPIPTFFNGVEIPTRKILREFTTTLPTEIADENGVSRKQHRETAVRLYELLEGEKPTLYEMGMPVVEIDGKWHVDIQQKVPLNIERDNVTPSYLKAVFASVLNERKDYLTEEEAAAAWVNIGLADARVTDGTVKAIVKKRFGDKAVIYDRKDKGSNKECTSKDYTVVPIGSLPKEVWENVKRAGAMPKAGEVCPTDTKHKVPAKTYTDDELNPAQLRYRRFLEDLAPLMIGHTVIVRFIDDDDVEFEGCTRWKEHEFLMEVNMAFHDPNDWDQNYELLIHEFAHHAVQSNDHLVDLFYDTVTEMGAKLVRIALTHPSLFPNPQEPLLREEAA
jgi:hypothetical protein